MNNDLLIKLKEIIAGQLGVDENEITLNSHLQEDLNADPLSVADLFVKLEDEFSVKIPQEHSSRFNTVEDILNYISEQTGDI